MLGISGKPKELQKRGGVDGRTANVLPSKKSISITSKLTTGTTGKLVIKTPSKPKVESRTVQKKSNKVVASITSPIVSSDIINIREIAIELLSREADSTSSGEAIIRWNHYKKPFPVKNGVIKFEDIDAQYCFSFVYRGQYKRMLKLENGTDFDNTNPNLICDVGMDYFIDANPNCSYKLFIEEDPIAGIGLGDEGLTLRSGPIKWNHYSVDVDSLPQSINKKNRQVSLITKELLNMKVDDLHSADAKALKEARDIEDILFSSS